MAVGFTVANLVEYNLQEKRGQEDLYASGWIVHGTNIGIGLALLAAALFLLSPLLAKLKASGRS